MGIVQIGDLLRISESLLEKNFGKWGVALAGKARGEDAGGWFEGEVGEEWQAKSVSHEHTFSTDTGDREELESTMARLSEMVGRRLRENGLAARTIQIKLRYSDFSTITRAQSVAQPTAVDTEIFQITRKLFLENWEKGRAIRLLGVHASHFEDVPEQLDLLEGATHNRWTRALSASDRLRDKYGDHAVFLAKGMASSIRERIQENPAERKEKKKTE